MNTTLSVLANNGSAWKTVADAIVPVVTILAPALLAWILYKQTKLSSEQKAQSEKTAALDIKIKDVEKSSNGMQAALLTAGARASFSEGKEIGRQSQKLEDQASMRIPAAGGESANTAKVAEIIAVVDNNVREVDKKVEVIDENVKEVHETVVKQTEIKTKT